MLLTLFITQAVPGIDCWLARLADYIESNDVEKSVVAHISNILKQMPGPAKLWVEATNTKLPVATK